MSKVAAINTSETNYAAKGHDYDPYLTAFITGANGYASSWDNEKDTNSTLVIRGIGSGSRRAIIHCWETSRDFYAIDTGYFGNNKHKFWHRVTKNSLQNTGPIVSRPLDRLEAIGYEFKPFTSGRKILICPPSDKAMSLWNQGTAKEWTDNIVENLKALTDRPIEIRMKPIRRERISTNTIQQVLADDVHCLVTYNSIAATEALMEGKPAITLGPNAAQLVCETDLSKIENPRTPTKEEMLAFMAHLSYAQFSVEEMSSGYAWKILQGDEQ